MLRFSSHKKTYVAIIIAALALFFFVIANHGAIDTWWNKIMSVLSPILVGLIMAYLFNFIMRPLESKAFSKIKRPMLRRCVSLLTTYLIVLILIGLFLLLLIPQLVSSFNDLTSKANTYVRAAIDYANNFLNKFTFFEERDSGIFFDEQDILDWLTDVLNNAKNLLPTVADYVTSYASKVVIGLKDFLIGFFISIYVLFSKERIAAQSKRLVASLFSVDRTDGVLDTVKLANTVFGKYISGQALDAFLVAIVSLICFSIFHIPYPFLIATIVGITNVIPFFGPFIGAIPSAFIVFITNPPKMITFILLILIIQQIDGNIIAPKIIGNVTGISSLGVIIAITLSSGFLGIVGMFVGVPLYAVIITVCRRTLEGRLTEKGLPSELGHYYPENATVPYSPPQDKGETSFFHIIKKIGGRFKPTSRK